MDEIKNPSANSSMSDDELITITLNWITSLLEFPGKTISMDKPYGNVEDFVFAILAKRLHQRNLELALLKLKLERLERVKHESDSAVNKYLDKQAVASNLAKIVSDQKQEIEVLRSMLKEAQDL